MNIPRLSLFPVNELVAERNCNITSVYINRMSCLPLCVNHNYIVLNHLIKLYRHYSTANYLYALALIQIEVSGGDIIEAARVIVIHQSKKYMHILGSRRRT